jgi:hypothetical protein
LFLARDGWEQSASGSIVIATGADMSPPSEPADLSLEEPLADIAVADRAAPIFGIVLGMLVMIALALNALAY